MIYTHVGLIIGGLQNMITDDHGSFYVTWEFQLGKHRAVICNLIGSGDYTKFPPQSPGSLVIWGTEWPNIY